MFCQNASCDLYPLHVWHVNIHQDNLRLKGFRLLRSTVSIITNLVNKLRIFYSETAQCTRDYFRLVQLIGINWRGSGSAKLLPEPAALCSNHIPKGAIPNSRAIAPAEEKGIFNSKDVF
jgi:hypothetical protein